MKTDYLVLPFYSEIAKTSLKSKSNLNLGFHGSFKIYTTFNRLLPFVCEVLDDCNFTITIKDYYGNTVFNLPRTSFEHKVFSVGTKNYLVYFGSKIPCLELGECAIPYSIQVGNLYSEWFWVTDKPEKMLKVEIGNSIDFSEIPYSTGFKQIFYLDSNFGTSETIAFTVSTKDARGNVSTNYQRLSETFEFYFFNTPAHLKQVFASFEVLDYVKLSNNEQELFSEPRESKIKSKRNETGFSFYDLELSILSNKYEEIGICEDTKFIETSCFVSVIEAQNCEIESIENVLLNCNDDPQPNCINGDCNPVEAELFFYATVVYN